MVRNRGAQQNATEPSTGPASTGPASTGPASTGEPRIEASRGPNSHPLSVIRDAGERPLVLRSVLRGPIAQLTFLQQSLLFAELSMIAYNDPAEARRAVARIGFSEVMLFCRDGAQAYRFRNRHDCVIACRGTEPDDWNDVRADVNARSVVAETVGRVHRGFKKEVDDLWPMIETALLENGLPVYFCGHSLGGAMATISAGRCQLSHIRSHPAALFTYGSPRVGDKRYINHVTLKHFRFVHNNDIVTRIPPAWLGYRHSGQEIYLDRHGQIRQLGRVSKRRDRWRGFLRGLRGRRFDHFADHSIHGYLEAIAEAVAGEQGGSHDRRRPSAAATSQASSAAAAS